jgi:hypothetical protein
MTGIIFQKCARKQRCGDILAPFRSILTHHYFGYTFCTYGRTDRMDLGLSVRMERELRHRKLRHILKKVLLSTITTKPVAACGQPKRADVSEVDSSITFKPSETRRLSKPTYY